SQRRAHHHDSRRAQSSGTTNARGRRASGGVAAAYPLRTAGHPRTATWRLERSDGCRSGKVEKSNLTFFAVLFQRQHVFGRCLFDESRGRIEAERFRHVLNSRKVAQVVEAEPNQELLRRRIEKRTSNDILPADDLDQVTLE